MTRSSLESCIARLLVAAVGVGLAAPAAADRAEDDLQAVKKALLASTQAQARPPAEDPAQQQAQPKPPTRSGQPMWLRVRVVEKGSKRARVAVNLPIGLVRALGDDWPIPAYHGCHKRDHCGATLGEILRALDTGQNLFEIEDDEASARVWIE